VWNSVRPVESFKPSKDKPYYILNPTYSRYDECNIYLILYEA
jgi:hypothetical protein